jgi:hypothetical protein
MKTSQGVGFPQAERASFNVSSLTKTAKTVLIRITAAIGNGVSISPNTVPTNKAKKCHANTVRPAGTGINHKITEARRQTMALAPLLWSREGGLGLPGMVLAADGRTCGSEVEVGISDSH